MALAFQSIIRDERNRFYPTVYILSVLLSGAGLLFFSGNSSALDLQLSDRLKTPAKDFGSIQKTAFLDIQKISDRILVVGERGVIAYSDDQGDVWQQSEVPVSSLITSVHFPTNDLGWAVGHGGSVLHSVDSGSSWKMQLNGSMVNDFVLKKAQDNLQQLKDEFEQTEEAVQGDLKYEIEDAEFALSNARFDVALGPANPFLDVLFLNDKKGFAVGAYGLFVFTEDAGLTWHSIAGRLENFDRYHLNTIAQLKGGAILIAGEAGTLFVSYDQGEQWETLYGPYQGSFFGIQATVNEDEALLYGLKGHIFKTQNGGQSWKEIHVDVETSLTSSAMADDGRIIISGFSGVLLISADNGESFSRIETKGFEGFNGLEFAGPDKILLVSDEGIHKVSID